MNTNLTLYLAALCFLSSACHHAPTDHPVFKYYPSEEIFKEGFVSKYYLHYYPVNPNQEAGTEIYYAKHIKQDESHFSIERYSAGFDLEDKHFYAVHGDSLILERGISTHISNPEDTTELDLVSKTITAWNGDKRSPYQVRYTFDNQQYLYSEYQTSVYDTVINEQPAKVFTSEYTYNMTDQDSIIEEGKSRSIYVQGLGFFGDANYSTNYTRKTELIEQMSVAEFERRANHRQHRIAWIDPENTISDDTNFDLCGHERRIADYYNSTPDGRYAFNKRAMLDTINTHLNESHLFSQSGRLVFRFVVNCNGQAGRFIVEGYDMNYQKMEFRQETVDHLFEILQKLEQWRPVVIRGEARDAYFYITFNLENGKVINILP